MHIRHDTINPQFAQKTFHSVSKCTTLDLLHTNLHLSAQNLHFSAPHSPKVTVCTKTVIQPLIAQLLTFCTQLFRNLQFAHNAQSHTSVPNTI